MTEPRYDNLYALWRAWFRSGWPAADDIDALERDIHALVVAQHKPKHEARQPSPLTMIGKGAK